MSKIPLLPGKVAYSGPTKFAGICNAIIKDAADANIELSYDFVYRVIRLFFGRILFYMRYGNYITIKGLGEFGMTKEEKKKRVWNEELAARNRYVKYLKKIEKLIVRRKKHDRLDKVNNYRAVNGMKPLTIDEFITITKRRKNRKLKTYSKFNYTFEILDALETSK